MSVLFTLRYTCWRHNQLETVNAALGFASCSIKISCSLCGQYTHPFVNKALTTVSNPKIIHQFMRNNKSHISYRYLVSLVGKVPLYRAGGSGSIPGRTNTKGLKITMGRRCCLCSNICKWIDFRVFSDKDVKP